MALKETTMDYKKYVSMALAEVAEEVERQDQQWGHEHDQNHTTRDWIGIVVKHLGKAFSEDDERFKYPHEKGVDRRFIKIAAICVSAAVGLRSNFR